MTFDHKLKQGQVLDNEEIQSTFLCSGQGGMRRSHRTNSLVLISDHTKSLYEDRWDGDIFYYTGMGLAGDQSLDFSQNRTLAQSPTNGVDVFLFEVFEPKKYVFVGTVELAGEPYQEQQLDSQDTLRLVWMFPLKLTADQAEFPVSVELLHKKAEIRQRAAESLSLGDLTKRAQYASKKPAVRAASVTSYERNAYVSELAKRKANGKCQLCGSEAPFKDRKGQPYLETHHIVWLSKGGQDTEENTVALCPNCHRKMHALNLYEDKELLRERAGSMHALA